MPVKRFRRRQPRPRDAALQGALHADRARVWQGRSHAHGRRGRPGAPARRSPPGALYSAELGAGHRRRAPAGASWRCFGPESSGKTTLIYHVLAEAQKLGGVCAVHRRRATRWTRCTPSGSGWTSTSCSCLSPTTASRRWEIADMLVRSGAVDVVLDRLRSLRSPPRKGGWRGQMDDTTVVRGRRA